MELPVMLLVAILAMLVVVGEGRTPVLHRVGGNKNAWKPNVNFLDWASHECFYVGDWLYFGFDKRKLSVLEVNKTGYKNCRETNLITNITRGGRDVFNLTVARAYYFISGRGYCFRGVKLAITVYDAPSDHSKIPTPSPINSHAATTLHCLCLPLLITIITIITLDWTF
ncbi:hypothetical protein Cgig2_007364 [Carnegiea gigantea]|uniref:Phytocyanin domain-containing protein n=1 Tax=Carnegiea gigantea TaxID=171969 RepID=A0A9Q1KZY7_9CARY|nr:hypothetical protein Cgig2_007364 [Carnegiea gigantea]